MTCKSCEHWNPRNSGEMAKHHMAVCNKGPLWVYMPPQGKCNDFKEADADVIAKRAEWLEKKA